MPRKSKTRDQLIDDFIKRKRVKRLPPGTQVTEPPSFDDLVPLECVGTYRRKKHSGSDEQ